MARLLGVLCEGICHCVAFGDVILVLLEAPAEISAFTDIHRFTIGARNLVNNARETFPRERILHVHQVTFEFARRHMRDLYAVFPKDTR